MKKLYFLLFALLMTSLTCTAQNVTKTANLSLDAGSIDRFGVNAGSGFLIIEGDEDEDASSIRVRADIELRGVDEDDMDKYITLELEKRGNSAYLVTDIENKRKLLGQNINGQIDLTITVPRRLALVVNDGSGNITISSIANTVSVDDGSGSMDITSIGENLDIDDGSGSMSLSDIDGDVIINDGSGSVDITGISGFLEIDDGSGSIDVERIGGDIEINDGSGNIDIMKAGGSVTLRDGSGNIDVRNVASDLIVKSSGSGNTQFSNIAGRIINN